MKLPQKYLAIIENADEKTRYCIFAGLLIFIFLLDYLLIMGPQLKMLSQINPKISVLSEDINKAKTDIDKAVEYREEVKSLRNKVDLVNLKIKSKNELAYVLSSISRVASESGVKIDQIIPNPQDLTLLMEKGERKYYALPIMIEARAGYHNFGRFLNRLETEDLSLRIGTFTISSTNDVKYHSIKLILNAIVFEE